MTLRKQNQAAVRLGAKCHNCPLRSADGPILPAVPQRHCEMIVCGQEPGPTELALGSYFQGASGDLLDEVAQFHGIPYGRLHLTNVLMCRDKTELSDEQWKKAVECCRPRLKKELDRLRTRTVLALGGRAMEALTGLPYNRVKYHIGMPLECQAPFRRYTALASYHPAHLLRPEGGYMLPSLFTFMGRAWDLALDRFEWETWPEIIIQPTEEAEDALATLLNRRDPVGFDVETRGTDPMRSLCMCLGIAGDDVAVSVPWEQYTAGKWGVVESLASTTVGRKIAKLVKRILASKVVPTVAQNGPHDILTAERLGLQTRAWNFDTLPAHVVAAQGMFHDLGSIAVLEGTWPRWKTEFHATTAEKGLDAFAKRKPEVLRTYNAKDAWVTLQLKARLERRLADTAAGPETMKLLMKLWHVALNMQRAGFKVDTSKFDKHREVLSARSDRAKYEVRAIAKKFGIKDLNPNSVPQLRRLIYKKMKMKAKRFSPKTGEPSTDERTLKDLVVTSNALISGFGRGMLRYKKNEKLKQYLDESKLIDDVLHVGWNPSSTRTQRWAPSPNLTTIPKPVIRKVKRKRPGEKERGTFMVAPGLRDIFIAFDDGWVVCADYDQLELRILAQLTNDAKLIKIFKDGRDPHAENAADWFGCKVLEVSKDERDIEKNGIYGIYYGITETGLWEMLHVDFPDISLADVYKIVARYKKSHPEVVEWQRESLAEAKLTRIVVAPLSGARQIFYCRFVEANKVYNWPVQRTAAEMINSTIPKIAKHIDWKKTFLAGQIHDELIGTGPNPLWLAKLFKKYMTMKSVRIGQYTIPYTVGIKMGPSWGEAISIKKGESLVAGTKRICKKFGKPYKHSWERAAIT